MKRKVCPACGSTNIRYVPQGDYYKCDKCKFVIDPTMLEKPLRPIQDPSSYSDEMTEEEAMEEDLALLNEEDDLW